MDFEILYSPVWETLKCKVTAQNGPVIGGQGIRKAVKTAFECKELLHMQKKTEYHRVLFS